jgi:malate dehydrogenase
MLSALRTSVGAGRRLLATAPKGFNVAVLGAAGGIGQSLSLLLKSLPLVDSLRLYDIKGTYGVAADCSHVPTKAKVTGHEGPDELPAALKDADYVIVPAGMPRKPGMTRDDLFTANASIVLELTKAIADHAPEAMIALITNPVNATVPIAREVLKAKGVYDKRKLFGVTTLDVCRTRTFVAEKMNVDPHTLPLVTVVGGHAGTTILPLLSQIPNTGFDEETIKALTHRIQFGGDEVVQAKAGAGSATLSMAFAGAMFTKRVLAAAAGEKDMTACAFVQNSIDEIADGCPFFASMCEFGENGVEAQRGFGELSAFEQESLDALIPELAKSAKKGAAYAMENL